MRGSRSLQPALKTKAEQPDGTRYSFRRRLLITAARLPRQKNTLGTPNVSESVPTKRCAWGSGLLLTWDGDSSPGTYKLTSSASRLAKSSVVGMLSVILEMVAPISLPLLGSCRREGYKRVSVYHQNEPTNKRITKIRTGEEPLHRRNRTRSILFGAQRKCRPRGARGAGTKSHPWVPTPLGTHLPRYPAPSVPNSLGTCPMGLGT